MDIPVNEKLTQMFIFANMGERSVCQYSTVELIYFKKRKFHFNFTFLLVWESSLKDKHSCVLGVIILLCNNPVILLIRAPDKRGY